MYCLILKNVVVENKSLYVYFCGNHFLASSLSIDRCTTYLFCKPELVSMLVTRHECIYALLTNTISNAFKASCRVMAARNDKRRPSRPDPPPYKQSCMPRHIVVCNKQLQQLGQVHPITKQPAKPCIVINNCHVARLYTHR